MARMQASEFDEIPRVMITGSRKWTDTGVIKNAFRDTYSEMGAFTLVSGHCPTGADAIGEFLAKKAGLSVEIHPARWEVFGKAAGFIRNEEMINSGVDLVLAFIKDNSPGSTHAAKVAELAGISVRRFIK